MAKKKTVKVKSHTRVVDGKLYKVKGFKRTQRAISKRAKRTTKVGTMVVRHDKFGNLIGSKIIPLKKKRKQVPLKQIRRQTLRNSDKIESLDKRAFTTIANEDDPKKKREVADNWLKRRQKLMGFPKA